MTRRSHIILIVWLVGLLLVAASTMLNVAAGQPPVAAFTHSPEEPLVNQYVAFNASASYDPDGYPLISYEWNFGDDSPPIILNESVTYHNYTREDSYNITLTVTDKEGLTGTAWHIVTVEKHPVATFTYSPAYPLVGQLVTFNASLSTPNGGTIVNYTWAFDDGNVTTVTYPVLNHSYIGFGTKNVTLTVADSEGLSDAFWDTVRILIHPVAIFTYSPSTPIVNQMVTLDASASYDPDSGSTIVNYTWNFGDGNVTTVTYPVLNHTYTTIGTKNVSLTVTDDDGLTNETSKLIVVLSFFYTHDVAIVSVTSALPYGANAVFPQGPKIVWGQFYPGWYVNITVVARNEGNATESFSVTVRYGNETIETRDVSYLAPGESMILAFTWNVTGVAPCRYNFITNTSDPLYPGYYIPYTLSASASRVPGETDADAADNLMLGGNVTVRLPGDATGSGAKCDGQATITDLGQLGICWTKKYPAADYDWRCDWNGDGQNTISDLGLLGIYWSKKAQPAP